MESLKGAGECAGCIDIGTYSTRLLVAKIGKDIFQVLLDTGRVTNLGRGFLKSHRLSPEAIQETSEALQEFARQAQAFQATHLRVVATEAVRSTSNADSLLTLAHTLTPDVEILTPQREAFLSFSANHFVFSEGKPHPLFVMDEGGGSTEISWGTPTSFFFRSFPFGVLTLTEEFLHHNPPDPNELHSLREFLENHFSQLIAPLRAWVDSLSDVKSLKCIVLGGTITTLSALAQGLSQYDSTRVHGSEVPLNTVNSWLKSLGELPLSQRANYPVMGERRAYVMIAGLMEISVLFSVLCPTVFPLNILRVSEWGIRHGALLELRGCGFNRAFVK